MKYSALLTIAIGWLMFSCNNSDSSAGKPENDSTQTNEQTVINISPVKQGEVKTDNVTLGYKTMGEGEPLVVLHAGPGLWSDYLIPYLKPLSKKYKLIFLDQRGNSTSSFPVD